MRSVKLLLWYLLLVFSVSLYASTGKIVGIVSEKGSNDALIGVNVVLENTTLGSTTDVDGSFIILNVPPGTYVLVAQYIGYSDVRYENVKVSVNLTTEVNITMQEATVELGDVITVTADQEMITKDLTASTARVDADRIASLPVTEVSEVLGLQAGYVDGHVRGGRTGEIAYLIDGIPVTDGYDGSQVVSVNKDVIEELQFITGAFNAEYGQALSGVVNITTKEPKVSFGADLTVYAGDYLSSHDNIFWNTNNFNPGRIQNYEGSVYGQIVPSRLSYFLNARWVDFTGHLYGQRVYNPQNVAYEDPVTGDYILSRDSEGAGDGEYVSLNGNQRLYLQGKLLFYITPLIKTAYTIIRDDVERQDYDRDFRLNPDGQLNKFELGTTHLFKWSHSLSDRLFYDVGLSFFDKQFDEYVYQDPTDPRHIHPRVRESRLPNNFLTGGTNNNRFSRRTRTYTAKLDLTNQLTKNHLIKAGLEYRQNQIDFDRTELRPAGGDEIDLTTDSPYMNPLVLGITTPFRDIYTHEPNELSAYIQDKMEYGDFIVNIGLRVDHFKPDGVVLNDPSDPNIYNPLRLENRFRDANGNGSYDVGEQILTLADREAYWYRAAGNKTQFSPRLGAAFPITSRGVVHFSYGHFFKIPNFELLYRNPQFRLGNGTGNQGIIGNADLNPEQTISAEIGLQQQVSEDWKVDVTAYVRDIRDLTGTRADEIQVFGGSQTYSLLVNSDFGYVRGFIMALEKRYTPGFNMTLDYTFQVAEATASDPNAAQQALAGGNQPEVLLIPLTWDQRHTLNNTFSYNRKSFDISLLSRLGSGQSYTPRRTSDVSGLRENSEKKPLTWTVDMRVFYDFKLFDQKSSFFLRVFNLFDRLNETGIYDDTGRAGFTTDLARLQATGSFQPVNSLEDWFRNETFYSQPRRIEAGLIFAFK